LTHALGKTEINTYSRQGQPKGRAQSLDGFATAAPNFPETKLPRHL
jgi:hypothetical protein